MRRAAEVGSTANSYQILAKLAAGGMAEIFLARGASVAGVERYVVLKRILPDRASDVHFVRMFLDEARLAAQLQHPNIAQVFDIGKLGDSYFFTMEYVHGETVRAVLARGYALRRQLPVGSVLTIIAQTASGLHHAHDRIGIDGRPLNIVHRDVSPSNLMVSFEGNVKVVDFGVAKAADRLQETRAGTVKGKISYLSPEQCRGSGIDRRSDLFALGIVMWEMLTGERLYRRDSDFENMTAIVTEPPPLPSSIRSDIPPGVDAVVMRLLDKSPENRFQSCDAVVEAIEEAAMRARITLSVTALSRLLREMFGHRPEPWIELRAIETPVEAVTVTSEPVPAEIIAVPVDAVRAQLASVIDLSTYRERVTEGLPVVPVAPVAPRPLSASGPREAPVLAITPPAEPSPEVALATASPTTSGLVMLDPPRRAIWPISVAIVIAAGLGAGAVWLAMRSSGGAQTPDAALVVLVGAADAAAMVPDDALTVAEDGTRPRLEEPDAAPALDAMAVATDAAESPRIDAGREEIDPIVSSCQSTAMTAKLAPSCTLAACNRGLAATARNWYAFAPASKRSMLVTTCKAAGVVLEAPRRPPQPPPPPRRIDAGADDCSDPLACQH